MPRIVPGRIFLPGVLAVLTMAGPSAAAVDGKLEWVGCEGVTGWAQDSDDPANPVTIELTFDAPYGEKSDGAFFANTYRDDLCGTLGSCEHGFDVAPPYSLFDGEPHAVYVYADGPAGSAPTLLPGSPATLVCAALSVSGSKRRIATAATSVNWRFDFFWNGVALDDLAIDSLPDDPELPEAPVLARADDGSPDVWLLDGTLRRAVSDESVIAHWRFSKQAIGTRPAADLQALEEGPPLGSRPLVLHSSVDELFLVDAELPIDVVDGAEPEPLPDPTGPTGAAPAPADSKASCAARLAPGAPAPGQPEALGLGLMLALALIRSRSARR